jgi:hypothetical protein
MVLILPQPDPRSSPHPRFGAGPAAPMSKVDGDLCPAVVQVNGV